MKRVLYVAYYFPPAGGPGVQRSLKFVRYLPAHGWQPTVVSVRHKSAAWPAVDPSMLAEIPESVDVIRTRSWDPYAAYARLKGRAKEDSVGVGFADPESPGAFERFARFVRANLFIPDARVGWVPFAKRAVARQLRSGSFDAIITSGPPHSTHAVGRWASKRFGIPWLADFRDPWGELSYYDQLPFLPWSRALDAALERRTLAGANAVVTVSPAVGELLSAKTRTDVDIIPNGFDPGDFRGAGPLRAPESGKEFHLVYVGTLTAGQNPEALWGEVARLRAEGKPIRVHLVGRVDAEVVASLARAGLDTSNGLNHTAYVPHEEAIGYMRGADTLLLCVPRTEDAAGILTGKLFEYLAAGRPVLAMGPAASDAARVLSESGAGTMVEFDDPGAAAHYLRARLAEWEGGAPGAPPNEAYLARYTRESQAGDLAHILNRIASE